MTHYLDGDWGDMSERVRLFFKELKERIPIAKNDSLSKYMMDRSTPSKILLSYLNYSARFVMPMRRSIFYRDNFWSNEIAKREVVRIITMERRLIAGEDISAFLSKKTRISGFHYQKNESGRSNRTWKDKDFAVNAYGIHHLHLKEDGRGDELLFVAFRRNEAIFLFVGTHIAFKDGSLDSAATWWRDVSGWELRGVMPAERDWAHEERLNIAYHGGGVSAVVDGRVIMQTMIATSGHSISSVRLTDRIILVVKEYDKYLESESGVEEIFGDNIKLLGAGRHFEWVMDHQDLCIFERESRVLARMVLGPY